MADDVRATAMAEERGAARYARIANDFLHDMATGTWAACLLVLLVLSRRLTGVPPEAASALADAMQAVFRLLLAALTVLAVTGGVRLSYWRRRTHPGDVAAKRRTLLVKHAAFALVYGAGTWWGWTLLP